MTSPKKIFCCDFCDYKTKRSSLLVCHIRKHTGEKPFICNYCDYKTTSKETLTHHIRNHRGERPHKCDNCDYSTSFRSSLRVHRRKHTGELPYKCSQCNFKAAYLKTLDGHINNHKGLKPYHCNLCDFKSANKNALSYHLKAHKSKKYFSCEFCHYSTISRSMLAIHRSQHLATKPYKCDICGYNTSRRVFLISHLRTHTGQKKYKCNLCDAKYTHRKTLLQHKRNIHFKGRKYHCDNCNFSNNANIRNSVYSYKCETCNLSFIYRPCLNAHLLLHTKNNLLNCNHCDFKTLHQAHLEDHLATTHLNNNSNELLQMSEGLNQAEIQDGLLDNYNLFMASDDLLEKDTNMHDSQVEDADCDLTLFSNEELINISPLKQNFTNDNLANNEATVHVPEEKTIFEESLKMKDLIECIPSGENQNVPSVESELPTSDSLSLISFKITSLNPTIMQPLIENSCNIAACENIAIKNDQQEKENSGSINIENVRYFVLTKEGAKGNVNSSELLGKAPNLKGCFAKTIIIMKV